MIVFKRLFDTLLKHGFLIGRLLRRRSFDSVKSAVCKVFIYFAVWKAIFVLVVAKWEALPTLSSLTISSHRNNYMVGRYYTRPAADVCC